MSHPGGARTRHAVEAPDRVWAPYNFVPLSKEVVVPKWGPLVSQDRPFRDGLCGCLSIEIEALTPLLVGGRRTKEDKASSGEVAFVEDGDGRPMIPGSTLKGMVRNVVEIASFSRFAAFDDRRFGFRDLTSAGKAFYGDRLTDSHQGAFRSLVKSGFLRYRGKGPGDASGWEIVPCEYGRVEHSTLEKMKLTEGGRKLDQPPSYRRKQDLIVRGGFDLVVRPDVPKLRHPRRKGVPPIPIYERRFAPDTIKLRPEGEIPKGFVPATLVVTGPASLKHREFVFYDAKRDRACAVPQEVMKPFLAMHEDDAGDRETPWGFWRHYLFGGKPEPEEGKAMREDEWAAGGTGRMKPTIGPGGRAEDTHPGIPVFYLTDTKSKQVAALGLAQMFKLPHVHSTRDLVEAFSGRHSVEADMDRPEWDLGELLFGTASHRRALKGRVSFGHAGLSGTGEPGRSEHRVVLSSPKPSYFPFYLQQATIGPDHRSGPIVDKGGEGRGYVTYSPPAREIDNPPPPAEPRGWKRYLPRGHVARSQADATESVQSVLHAVVPGTKFAATLTFHNLRPAELGALAWALTLGDPRGRAGEHLVGMGKPYGLGRVAVRLGGVSIRPNDMELPAREGEDALAALDAARASFSDFMDEALGTAWAGTEQIRALLQLADADALKAKGLVQPEREAYLPLNGFSLGKGRKASRDGRPGRPSRALPRAPF